jgi:hypothetical protein
MGNELWARFIRFLSGSLSSPYLSSRKKEYESLYGERGKMWILSGFAIRLQATVTVLRSAYPPTSDASRARRIMEGGLIPLPIHAASLLLLLVIYLLFFFFFFFA